MRPEDLFEILSDIDEDLVDKANSRRFEEEYVQPQTVTLVKKRFPWKAACAAAAVTVGAAVCVFWLGGTYGVLPPQSIDYSGGGSGEGSDSYPKETGAESSVSESAQNQAENGGETANVNVSPEPKRILALNENGAGWDDVRTFGLEEFPGAEFTWSAENLKITRDSDELILWYGMPVWNVYLCDLNGDGKREICSDLSLGSGIVDNRIAAYDFESGDLYELADRGNYDYVIDWEKTLLSSEHGKLYYSKREYNKEEIVESKALSLDIMTKINTVLLENKSGNNGFVIENTAEEAETSEEKGTWGDNIDFSRFKIYEPFGMTLDEEKKLLYFNGRRVRWFEDYYPIDGDGNKAGLDYLDEEGETDVYALRDLSEPVQNPDGSTDPSGKLIGLKEFTEEEFNARDIKALLEEKEVTHIAVTYGDETVTDDSSQAAEKIAESTEDRVLTDDDIKKNKEELLRFAEECKPFGVTYDEKADQWYFNGEAVGYFRDILTSNGESLSGGKFHGSMRTMSGKGKINIYTVRDFAQPDKEGVGKLIDIKAFAEGEYDPDAKMSETPLDTITAFKSALTLHELHKEADKTIEPIVHSYSEPEGAAPGGGQFPIEYEGSVYEYNFKYCEFIADKDGNITDLEASGDWKPNAAENGADALMMKFDELEYLGRMGETYLGAWSFREADIYRYGDALLVISSDENFLLYTWGIRKDLFGFDDNENSLIGNDGDRLKEALRERGIDYDPNVVLHAMLYEKSDRIEPWGE